MAVRTQVQQLVPTPYAHRRWAIRRCQVMPPRLTTAMQRRCRSRHDYGVPRGACAPGQERIAGAAVASPLPQAASGANTSGSSGTDSDLLGLFAISHRPGGGAYKRQTPPSPPYNSTLQGSGHTSHSGRSYQVVLPHDALGTEVVLVSRRKRAVTIDGCILHNAAGGALVWEQPSGLPGIDKEHAAVRWAPDVTPGVPCAADVLVCPAQQPCTAAHPQAEAFRLTVVQRLDPGLARIVAITVAVGGESAQICAADAWNATGLVDQAQPKAAKQCASRSQKHINAMATAADACALPKRNATSALSASLLYQREESIEVTVRPMLTPGVSSVLTIGQQNFIFAPPLADAPGQQSGQIKSAATPREAAKQDGPVARVSFTLFDRFDTLSLFVPFFIRQRSSDRVVLDVPVTLTLSDHLTSLQQNLTLTVNVAARPPPLLPPPPPPSRLPVPRSADAGTAAGTVSASAANSTGSVPAAPARPSESGSASVLVPTEAPLPTSKGASPRTSSTVVAQVRVPDTVPSDAQDAAPSVPHTALGKQAQLQHERRRRGRRLQSSNGTDMILDQEWLEDPLANPDCAQCPRGSYSYTCVLIRRPDASGTRPCS
jgi:hypothetical protein